MKWGIFTGQIIVKDCVIGQGRPKIVVPIVGITLEDILSQAERLLTLPADIAEWRIDYFEGAPDCSKVLPAANALQQALGGLPLLCTFRTAREGGEASISPAEYRALLTALAESGYADLLDIELFSGEETVSAVIAACRTAGVKTVVSSHDFSNTPPRPELLSRIAAMRSLGADIPKLAVMPHTPADVLTVLSVTEEAARTGDTPVATMSMSGLGMISRLCGECFGSALTFGCAEKASAPGQPDAEELDRVLTLLHKNL